MDIIHIRIILQTRIGCRTHEITEVAEHESRHHRIQIHNTDRPAFLVKQHIVHLRVTVVDVFFQFTLSKQHLCKTHHLSAFIDPIDDILAGCFAARLIRSQRFVKLLQTELHVMEVRDRLTQRIERQIRQLTLETTERLTGQLGRHRGHFLLRSSRLNQYIQTPIVTLRALVKQFPLFGRNQM